MKLQQCDQPKTCVGPYGPSGAACCPTCSVYHEEHPRPATCKCEFCKSKREGREPFSYDPRPPQPAKGE